jgi:hypothetical protein
MYNGIALALAWPETICKQAGAWYDKPMAWLGINKNRYYKVGHAAIVLVEKQSGSCHYFDFGRYHAPHQHGRVRSAFTDHDLEVKTKAIISIDGKLINYQEILSELQGNESCHGSGKLHASYCAINFEKGIQKVNEMQNNSPIPYGPFLPNGTNCSRFVNTILLSSKPALSFRFALMFPETFSPTPMSNIKALKNYNFKSVNTSFVEVFKSKFYFFKQAKA